jgi:predicted HNH restriction endonuclease
MKLQQQPLCEKCEAEGYTVPAEHVHHVRSFVQENNPQMRRELAFRLSNLQSLCASCHGGIHSHRIDV